MPVPAPVFLACLSLAASGFCRTADTRQGPRPKLERLRDLHPPASCLALIQQAADDAIRAAGHDPEGFSSQALFPAPASDEDTGVGFYVVFSPKRSRPTEYVLIARGGTVDCRTPPLWVGVYWCEENWVGCPWTAWQRAVLDRARQTCTEFFVQRAQFYELERQRQTGEEAQLSACLAGHLRKAAGQRGLARFAWDVLESSNELRIGIDLPGENYSECGVMGGAEDTCGVVADKQCLNTEMRPSCFRLLNGLPGPSESRDE